MKCKYIDADRLRVEITDLCTNANFYQQKAMEESNREDFVSSGGEIYAYTKVLSLIDSLQQEQKSGEWSDDDKFHLASIIGRIELCNKDTEDAASVLGYYDSDIAWLKSLYERFNPRPKLGAPVVGEVHHVLNCHYLATDDAQLCARLREFPEGAKVDIFIIAKEDEKP